VVLAHDSTLLRELIDRLFRRQARSGGKTDALDAIRAARSVLTQQRPAIPQAVLLLQPVLRCWAGRCRTCQQPIDLDQLPLFNQRE